MTSTQAYITRNSIYRMPKTWSSGVCDCFNDCSSCCCTLWCPCVQYGYNAEKLDSGSCCLCCFVTLVFNQAMCCFIMYQRGLVRSKYGIEGGPCGDCMSSFCCGPCTLCQMARELDFKQKLIK